MSLEAVVAHWNLRSLNDLNKRLVGMNEQSWWAGVNVDPLPVALALRRPWIPERSATSLREADLDVLSKLGKQGLE
jgi:hypothetical protein